MFVHPEFKPGPANPHASEGHVAEVADEWRDPNTGIAGSELVAMLVASETGSAEHALIRQAIITAHLPLVRFLAAQFTFRSQDYPEFVQVGVVGLIRAIDRFDPAKGNCLTTYAVPFISGEIRHFLRDDAGCIRIPRRIRDQRNQLRSTTAELGNYLGRDPGRKDLAAATGMSLSEVDEALRSTLVQYPISLDIEVAREVAAAAFRFGDSPVDRNLDRVDDAETLRTLLQGLPARSRRITRMYYLAGMSQAAIGVELGVSKVTVCRTLKSALRQMRASPAAHTA